MSRNWYFAVLSSWLSYLLCELTQVKLSPLIISFWLKYCSFLSGREDRHLHFPSKYLQKWICELSIERIGTIMLKFTYDHVVLLEFFSKIFSAYFGPSMNSWMQKLPIKRSCCIKKHFLAMWLRLLKKNHFFYLEYWHTLLQGCLWDTPLCLLLCHVSSFLKNLLKYNLIE